MARDNVTYLGPRKTGGKWQSDTPMNAPPPEDDAEDFDQRAYVWDRGEVLDKAAFDEKRRKRAEIERNGKDRL